MSVTGVADGPAVRLGVAIGDIAAGMFAFQGMLLALIARGRTDRGQLVDVSLLDTVAALLTFQGQRVLSANETPFTLRQPSHVDRALRHVRCR